MTPSTIASILAAVVLIAVFACVVIGIMALVDFAKFNRRPVDDQPPVSWLAKQEGRE